MTDLTPFEKEALRVGLLKMFRPDGHFSICDMDAMARLARVSIPQRTRDALQVLHCVSWSAMSASMRQATAQTILSIFEEPPLDLPSLDKSFMLDATPVASAGFFKRIMGAAQ